MFYEDNDGVVRRWRLAECTKQEVGGEFVVKGVPSIQWLIEKDFNKDFKELDDYCDQQAHEGSNIQQRILYRLPWKLQEDEVRPTIHFRSKDVPLLTVLSASSVFKALEGCDLRLIVPPYDKTEKEIIDNFKMEFESKKKECAVLIVRATSDSEKWTIAGFSDAGEFRTVDPSHELSQELKKEPINKSRIVELAVSSLGRTPLEADKIEGPGGSVSNELIQDRIVVIGGSFAESRDIYITPLGMMPGALIIINAIHSRLVYSEIREPEVCMEIIFAVLSILVAAYCFSKWPPFKGMVASFGFIILILVPISFYCFQYGVWINFVIPMIAIMLHRLYADFEELHS
jgi:hypothetical protein